MKSQIQQLDKEARRARYEARKAERKAREEAGQPSRLEELIAQGKKINEAVTKNAEELQKTKQRIQQSDKEIENLQTTISNRLNVSFQSDSQQFDQKYQTLIKQGAQLQKQTNQR